VGDVLSAQGRLDDALLAYRSGLEIGERLVAVDPSNAVWQHDLFVSYMGLGDIEEKKQNGTEASSDFAAAAEIMRRLAPLDPLNAGWQRDLALVEERLAALSAPIAVKDLQESSRWSRLWSRAKVIIFSRRLL